MYRLRRSVCGTVLPWGKAVFLPKLTETPPQKSQGGVGGADEAGKFARGHALAQGGEAGAIGFDSHVRRALHERELGLGSCRCDNRRVVPGGADESRP